mgnify:FL=1
MKRSIRQWIGLSIGGIVLFIIIFVAVVLTQRIDSQEAQNIALEHSGGGKIVSSEISKDILWNEYSYTIQNGNQWYDIEVNGFGNVEEIESGIDDSWRY